jgi:hypothetical protein
MGRSPHNSTIVGARGGVAVSIVCSAGLSHCWWSLSFFVVQWAMCYGLHGDWLLNAISKEDYAAVQEFQQYRNASSSGGRTTALTFK